tara:strand:- start:3839 stop:4279 length:441 start_codon:yes stop_codon:yes gene_type:complete
MRWWLEKDEEWDFSKIISYIKDFDTVHVGCDSKYYSSATRFAIAIAVYRNPCVTYWYTKHKDPHMTREIPHRLWTEVEKAMEVARMIREKLPNIKIEVHCDINSDEQFPSSKLNQSAMGYVTGCGFAYKNKPHAWCATGCADTHTR